MKHKKENEHEYELGRSKELAVCSCGKFKHIVLVDDGTLDTVFNIDGRRFAYDSDSVSRNAQGPTRESYQMALDDYMDDLAQEVLS